MKDFSKADPGLKLGTAIEESCI